MNKTPFLSKAAKRLLHTHFPRAVYNLHWYMGQNQDWGFWNSTQQSYCVMTSESKWIQKEIKISLILTGSQSSYKMGTTNWVSTWGFLVHLLMSSLWWACRTDSLLTPSLVHSSTFASHLSQSKNGSSAKTYKEQHLNPRWAQFTLL